MRKMLQQTMNNVRIMLQNIKRNVSIISRQEDGVYVVPQSLRKAQRMERKR